METTIVIIIWIALGIHSCYFFIKRYTNHFNLTTSNIPHLIVCFLLPIVTHFATLIVFKKDLNSGSKVLFKKRGS